MNKCEHFRNKIIDGKEVGWCVARGTAYCAIFEDDIRKYYIKPENCKSYKEIK